MCSELVKGPVGSVQHPQGMGATAGHGAQSLVTPLRSGCTARRPRWLVSAAVWLQGLESPVRSAGEDSPEKVRENESLGGHTCNWFALFKFIKNQHSVQMAHTQPALLCPVPTASPKRTNSSPPGRSGQASCNPLPTPRGGAEWAHPPGGALAVSTAPRHWGNPGAHSSRGLYPGQQAPQLRGAVQIPAASKDT